jgi:hypothetical protein
MGATSSGEADRSAPLRCCTATLQRLKAHASGRDACAGSSLEQLSGLLMQLAGDVMMLPPQCVEFQQEERDLLQAVFQALEAYVASRHTRNRDWLLLVVHMVEAANQVVHACSAPRVRPQLEAWVVERGECLAHAGLAFAQSCIRPHIARAA